MECSHCGSEVVDATESQLRGASCYPCRVCSTLIVLNDPIQFAGLSSTKPTIMPDFEKWGYILSLARNEPKASLELTIAHGLKEAFDQGYQLGRREGYEEGLNRGWAIEQDIERNRNSLEISNAAREFLEGLKDADQEGS